MGKATLGLCALAATLFAQEVAPIDAARAAYSKADYGGALTILEKGWEPCTAPDASDPACYHIARFLSRVMAVTGRPGDGERYLQMAILFRQAHPGPADNREAEELLELANLCRAQEQYERAVDVLQRLIAVYSRWPKYPGHEMADAFGRVGLLYLEAKKPEVAVGSFSTALSMREMMLGTDHPGLLPDLDRLSSTQITLRDYPAAELTFRRALVIRERWVGLKSPDLLPTLDGLAYSLFGQQNYDAAEPYYLRLLDLWLTSTGGDHPMMALTLDKLALFYREQKKAEAGDGYAARSLAVRKLFAAAGYAQEGTHQAGVNNEAALRAFRLGLAELDPSRPEHTELRGKLEKAIASLEPEKPQPTISRKKGTTDKKSFQKGFK
jgi:tetratricopeptide (TPR) repeat protein